MALASLESRQDDVCAGRRGRVCERWGRPRVGLGKGHPATNLCILHASQLVHCSHSFPQRRCITGDFESTAGPLHTPLLDCLVPFTLAGPLLVKRELMSCCNPFRLTEHRKSHDSHPSLNRHVLFGQPSSSSSPTYISSWLQPFSIISKLLLLLFPLPGCPFPSFLQVRIPAKHWHLPSNITSSVKSPQLAPPRVSHSVVSQSLTQNDLWCLLTTDLLLLGWEPSQLHCYQPPKLTLIHTKV